MYVLGQRSTYNRNKWHVRGIVFKVEKSPFYD